MYTAVFETFVATSYKVSGFRIVQGAQPFPGCGTFVGTLNLQETPFSNGHSACWRLAEALTGESTASVYRSNHVIHRFLIYVFNST